MAGFSRLSSLLRSEGDSAAPCRSVASEASCSGKPCCGDELPAWVRPRPPTKASYSQHTFAKPFTPASNRGEHKKRILPERLLTVADTASFFQVSEKTIRRLIARGELPVVRLGRLIRIDPEVIDKIIRKNE